MYSSDAAFAWANHVEAAVWGVFAVVFAAVARRQATRLRGQCVVAAVLFAIFGASDVVEVQTGAWWRPWWLLAWKAGCLLGLAGVLWSYNRHRRRRGE